MDLKKETSKEMPPVFLGTFQIRDLDTAVVKAYEYGCRGFDTAPSYGTEKALGKALKHLIREFGISREDFYVSDKVDALDMYRSAGKIRPCVVKSLRKMGLDYFDLLLIHWPLESYFDETWEEFAELKKDGLARAVGLCNINRQKYVDFIETTGLPKPQVIQNEISPFNTADPELSFFRDRGIRIQAYSPLCRMSEPIRQSGSLLAMSKKYNKTVAQVILRWHLDRGVIPVFTSSKISRLKENMDLFDFSLTPDEIHQINAMNRNYKIFPESFGCPGY